MNRVVHLLHERAITAAGGVVLAPENDPEFWGPEITFVVRVNESPTLTGAPTAYSLLLLLQLGQQDTGSSINSQPKWTNFDAYDYANLVAGGVGFYTPSHVGSTTGLVYSQEDSGSVVVARKMMRGCPARVRLRFEALVSGGTSPTASFNVSAEAHMKD